MITPSRWFSGGKGLDGFRDEMLHDRHICSLVDYVDNSVLFDTVYEFDGIEIDDGYYTTYGCVRENPDNPAGSIMKLIIALVRCDMDETEALIEASTGRYADEFDIPLCDMEEEYLEEQEYEDEGNE